jgi:hypothetical protein
MIGIPKIAQMTEAIATAFKGTWAQMTEIFTVEHDEDGFHTDITARSLTLTTNADSGATGTVTAGGDGTFNGTVTADADGTPIVIGPDAVTGPGIAFRNGTQAKWRWAATGGGQRNFTLRDELSVADPSALEIQATNIGATIDYTLMPHSATTRWFLGQDSGNQRWAEVNGQIVRANTGYYERGRTTPSNQWENIAFSAGNFTTSGGGSTWTVGSGDQFLFKKKRAGTSLTLAWNIGTSTIAGASAGELRITLPDSLTVVGTVHTGVSVADNGGTVSYETGFAQASNGNTYVSLFRPALAAYPTGADVWIHRGSIELEVA